MQNNRLPSFFDTFRRELGAGKRAAKSPTRRVRLFLDNLEERAVPAATPILPESLVSGTTALPNANGAATAYSPQVVISPLDSSKIVEVHATSNGIAGNYSTNGGQTWAAIPFPIEPRINPTTKNTNLRDPNIYQGPATFATPFAVTDAASVSFDRTGAFYVVSTQHNAANTSGAIVLHKFDFSTATAKLVLLNGGNSSVLYSWLNQDPAYNPIVAVDTNLPTYTDPITGAVTTDTLADQAFLANTTLANVNVLQTAMTNADLTLTLNTPTINLPPAPFYIQIGAEQLQVTNVAGNVLTVLRAQNGTTAAAHAAGVNVTTLPPSLGAISPTATSFDVTSTTNLPAVPFLAQVDSEQMQVTAITGNTLTVVRGVNGTTAVGHATFSTVGTLSNLPKGVYVAWSINQTQATNSQLPATLSHIVVRVSPDGGQTFTTTQSVSTPNPVVGSPYTVANYATPKIVFSQSGGKLNFFYDYKDLVFPPPTTIPQTGEMLDSTVPDGGVANAAVAAAQVFTVNNAGAIGDGLPNSSTVTTAYNTPIPAGGNTVFVPYGYDPVFVVGSNFLIASSATVDEQFRITSITNTTRSVTQLLAPPAATPDTLTVQSATAFQVGDLIQVGGEQMLITAKAGNTLTVNRGANGTLIGAFPVNSVVTNVTQVLWGISGAQAGTTAAPHSMPNLIRYVTANSSIPNDTAFTQTVNINAANLSTIKDLDVTINLVHPHLDQLQIVLTPPPGSGLSPITLVRNQVDANNTVIPNGGNPRGISGQNLGVIELGAAPFIDYNSVGTVFSDRGNSATLGQVADRRINDPNASAPYIGYFKPEQGSLASVAGLSNTALSGVWTLTITDFVNDTTTAPFPVQNLRSWSLNFTGVVDTQGFATDKTVTTGALITSVTDVNPLVTQATGTRGIGSGVSIAVDNSLGSFSPYQGRMYMVYNGGGGTNTNVFLTTSDDNGATWSAALKINDDALSDNFSEGNRPQFTPTVTVDPITGAVIVSYYDARNDAALARVATTVVSSIDGGQHFSKVSYANQLKTAKDFYTGKTIVLEPIPGNQSQAGSTGFGDRQGLVAYGGNVIPVFASNLNAAGSQIFAAKVKIAAGPRILQSDMGAVDADFTNLGGTYNNTFTLDGTRQLDGFTLQFDRPVEIASFDAGDVTVQYQDPNTGTLTQVALDALTPVTALDSNGFGPKLVGIGTLATTFFVKFATPQSKVGTYSYSVGPIIQDLIHGKAYTTVPTGAPTTYNSVDVPKTLPDLSTTTSNLVLPALPTGQVIGKVTVQLNLTHSYDGDLAITLISPSGTRILLSDHNGGFGSDYGDIILGDTVFDDAAALAIGAGTAPFAGSFKPDNPLSGFIGQSTLGTWQLEVVDDIANDTGILNSWSLSVTPAVLSVGTSLGNLMDQNANGVTAETNLDVFSIPKPTNGVPFSKPFDSQTLPLIIPGPHVVSTSVPNNPVTADNLVLNGTNNALDVTFDRDIKAGTFTTANADIRSIIGPVGPIAGPYTVTQLSPRTFRIGFASQTLSGSYLITIGPGAITDLAGNRVDTNLNAGLDVLRGGTDPANSPIVRPVYSAPIGALGVAIPAKTTVTSTLSITDSFQISQSTSQLQFSGNQQTFLTGPISATATSIDVSSSTGFPSTPFTVQIGTEQILVTATSLNTWTVTRGVNNTTAAAYASGTILVLGEPGTIQVSLSISDQDIRDLSATLTSPTGQIIELFANVGQTGSNPHANFVGTVFDDSAVNPIQSAGTPINVGPYNPKTPLSNLDGTGSAGLWKLTITNNGKSGTPGTLTHWELRLPKTIPSNGLGEPNADQFQTSFRIFTQATTNGQSSKQWTPVGPASNNSGGNSGRIGGLAFDPADPSGNSVFVAGASGGVWKTNNFLTPDANGPTYVPLTDFGPGTSLNIGSLATFGRNNDPNRTVVFAATGEGDVSSPGVGFLRSMDGGQSWSVLDSTTNTDAFGNILPMASPLRDHLFVGATSFKVVVDPTPLPNGNIVVYAALSGSGANGGIWRSITSGNTWTRIMAGNATDVVLASASRDPNGNLQRIYGAFRGLGVYTANNAVTAAFMNFLPGGGIMTPRVDDASGVQIPTSAPSSTPNGAKGRIVLVTPALTNNPLQDAFYQGWLYAAVVTPNNALDGVYLTKDFGLNWTKLNLPNLLTPGNPATAYPTNNETRPNTNPLGQQGNYDISFAIDPNNPNITYLGGSADFTPAPIKGMIRIDATTVDDPYVLSAYSNKEADGGLVQTATTGPTSGGPVAVVTPATATAPKTPQKSAYLNLMREPTNPFVSPSTIRFNGATRFNNSGTDVRYMPFNDAIGSTTDQHELIAIRDPLTGGTRLIFGDDQGVFTGVDDGKGNILQTVGANTIVSGARNGNLQITQFYYGAAQPSSLAAQLAGALFYGTAQDNGRPISAPDLLTSGNLNWTGPEGDATGVATDQTGSGTSYVYNWPCCGAISPTDFFGVVPAGQAEIGRTSGLVQPGDVITNTGGSGQWPFIGGSNFAVNPVDPTGIVMSSQAGRIFLTSGQSLGTGKQWFVIGNPANLDGTYAPAMAFGAQDLSIVGGTPNDFIYAGTSGGKIFVTFAGGGYNGSPNWRNISTGLDGSGVAQIVTNPKNGSHEAYAVTARGVYWMRDSSAASPVWVKLNDLTGTATTLAAAVTTTTATTIKVVSNVGFPKAPFVITLGSEQLRVNSINGTTWTVQRGFNNTVAATHAISDSVTQYNPLFKLTKGNFGNAADPNTTLQYLTSIQADWRFAIPDNDATTPTTNLSTQANATTTTLIVASNAGFPTAPFTVTIDSEQVRVTNNSTTTWTVQRGVNGTTAASHAVNSAVTLVPATHPVLYVGGEGGIFRSRDKGVTWTYYPNLADDSAVAEGGYLPNVHVTDLDLVLGNINPTTGYNDVSTGYNMLLATTYGRGDFAIRLDNSAISQYTVAPNSGPRVVNLNPIVQANGSQLAGYTITFGSEVDPNTFTVADMTITGPNGSIAFMAPIDVSAGVGHNVFEVDFVTPQTVLGDYTIKIGPKVLDLSGNAMDQNSNNVNGEPVNDVFTNTFKFISNTPPTITAIANQTVNPGVSTAPIAFTIGDKETPATGLSLTPAPFVTTPPGFVGTAPTVVIGGTGASRTVTVSTSAGSHGSAVVTITVQDPDGLQTSTTFTVNVDSAPVIPAIGTQTINHGTVPAPIPLNATDPDNDAVTFTVSFSDPLFAIKQQYGLGAPVASQFTNYRGQGELYIPATNNSPKGYLVLHPDGNLYNFDGVSAGGTFITTLPTTVYQNPDLLLTTTGNPLVSLPNPRYDFQQKYGLTIPAAYYNFQYANEYYLQSTKGLGFFILTNSNTLLTYPDRKLVADFTALGFGNVYANPTLITSAKLLTAPAITAATVGKPAGPGAGGSVTITPDPAFVGTVGVTVTGTGLALSTSQSFNYTVNNAAPTIPAIAPQSSNHTAPVNLVLPITDSDPDAGTRSYTVDFSNPLYDIRTQYAFNTAALPVYPNGAKYIFSSNNSNPAGSNYFYIMPDNKLYTYVTNTMVQDLNGLGDVYTNPTLLTNALPVPATASLNHGPLYDLRMQFGLNTAPQSFNLFGQKEMYFYSDFGGFFVLVPDTNFTTATLAPWDGVSITSSLTSSRAVVVGIDPYFSPTQLYKAEATVIGDPLFALRQKYGLNYADNYLNFYGFNEKNLFSAVTGAYSFFIKPDGILYQSSTTTPAGIPVANVGVPVYNNPALLYNTTGQAAAVTQTGSIVANNLNLTLTPNVAFTGAVKVKVTISDGAQNNSKSFVYKVTNAGQPTAPTALPTPLTFSVGSTGTTVSLAPPTFSDGNADPLSFNAVVTDPLVSLQAKYAFISATVADPARNNSKAILSGNGSNIRGSYVFLIKPVAGKYQLIAWDGSAGSGGTVVYDDVGLAVYNDPTLLIKATAPAALANVTTNIAGTNLNIAWPNTYTGSFFVDVYAFDGNATAKQSFLVKVS